MSNEAASPALSPNLRDEPAALYLMNMVEEPEQAPQAQHDTPSSHQQRQPGRAPGSSDQHSSPPAYQSQGHSYPTSPTYNPPGRRPSGARAIPPSNHSHISNEPISPVSPNRVENGRYHNDGPMQQQQQSYQQNGAGRGVGAAAAATTGLAAANARNKQPVREEDDDADADAAAYLAYAEQPLPQPPQPPKVSSPIKESEGRSSFAPSKAAEQRRANAEAAAQNKAQTMNVPGGGRRKDNRQQHRGNYNPDDESDEDEDEEEDDHDPPSSPPGRSHQQRQGPGGYNAPPSQYDQRNHYQHQQQYPQQQYQQQQYQQQQYQQQRGPLPPVPRGGGRGRGESMYGDELAPPSTLRGMSIQDDPGRSRSSSPPAPHRHLPHPNMPPQLAAGVAPAPKHNVWNANFSQEHGHAKKDGKFVELEEPAVQLTKAFTPGGLLQAGMQDKADRSARRQEEVARETGSSLLNIPEKPPPPSTGLVGAVAAHERDRKNAGGIGATLTDRDRERRLAEDRQRKIEELQRQQMDSMSQYGGFPQYGYGMPPQMMGGFPVSELGRVKLTSSSTAA